MRWSLALVAVLALAALAPLAGAQADTNSTSAASSTGISESGTATAAPAADADDGDGGGQSDSTQILAVVLPVLVGVALITVAALVVRHGAGHRHNAFFAALYFLSGLKSVSEGLRLKADDFAAVSVLFPPSLFWQLLALFCALGMMPLLFLFVSSFPRPLKWMLDKPRSAVLAFVPSTLMGLLLVLAVVGLAPTAAYLAAVSGFNFLFFLVTVAAILLILRTRATTPDPIERQQSVYVLLGFLPGFVAGWAVSALQFGASSGALDAARADQLITNIIQFISPVFELLACTLVAFAILKYNILGIDPKFRVGVKSTLVGMMFILLFLLTQFVENVILQGYIFSFAGDYGSFLFSGIAGVVLFKPIEKVSNKVSDKLLPTVAGADGLLPTEEIYHAQATYVLRDAKVTDRELEGLRNLRKQLKISDERARQIEEQVERLLHVDDARLGQQATGRAADPAAAPSAAGLGAATREADAAAASDLQVTLGAKAPARPAAASAKPAAKPRPAAAKAKPAAKAPPRTRGGPAGKAPAKSAKAPAAGAKRKTPSKGVRKGAT